MFRKLTWPIGVALTALLFTACGGPGGSAEPPPPSTFTVHTELAPRLAELPGIDGGPARPVAALKDENGTQTEFALNEIILVTDDTAALAAFLARWSGEVLAELDPASFGVSGLPRYYLVRVSAPPADMQTLVEDAGKLAAGQRNDLAFSTPSALDLFGVLAHEAAAGAAVTLNWVALPNGLESGANNEGATARVPSGKVPASGAPAYDRNANTWPYMQSGGPMDIGVTAAWRQLSMAGRLENKIGLAVLDGGFRPNSDLVGAVGHGGLGVPNPASCGSSPCPWHGTGTAAAAFAAVGNGYGAAGPGAPVANRILIQSPYDLWSYLTYPFNLLTGVSAARIINISATFVLPAVPAGLALGGMAPLSLGLRAAGILVVAAAGNDNLDLDAEDCFLVCWRKRTAFPCELGNVLCVGATDWANRNKADFSNYGRNVDIYGPGYVWVNDPDDLSNVVLEKGTSLASPFVAGVAALVWSANPSLGPSQVEEILLRTAHTKNGPRVGRVVNAAAAVQAALGNVPPVIRFAANPAQVGLRQPVRLYSMGTQPRPGELFSVYFMDGKEVTTLLPVQVRSDRDGTLYQSLDEGFNTPGRRTLTITATDPSGMTSTATLAVDVVNTPPTVTNVSAPTSIGMAEGWSPIRPVIATDVNEPGGVLPCSRVRWSVEGNDLPSPSNGCDTFIVFSEQGTRRVTITATDPEGATGTQVLTVNVGPRPAQIPPSVQGFVVRDARGAEVPSGTKLSSPQCPLRATATIYNPDAMPVNLSWTLDDGSALHSAELSYVTPDGSVVEIACPGRTEPDRRHNLSLFVGGGSPKKVFSYFAPPDPGPR